MIGAKRATKAEMDHMAKCKEGPCIPCLSRYLQGKANPWDVFLGGDYDHKKSGNIRRGHMHGFCNCAWHHRGHPLQEMSHAEMRKTFGPSLMDGSRKFREEYGTDDELIALQARVLENPAWETWDD